MAKAKKQATTKTATTKAAEGSGEAKGAGKRATGAKAESKKSSPGGLQGSPLIDTDLAAAAAASMVLSRATAGPATAGPAPTDGATGAGSPADSPDKRETSTFKQLKQNLSKPAGGGLGGILGAAQAGKKTNQPFGGGKQVGRNQTFGADVNRSGVPRRTGG